MRRLGPLMELFAGYGDRPALYWNGQAYSYGWMRQQTREWVDRLADRDDLAAGTVVAIHGDYSPQSLTLWFALMERGCITAPLTDAFEAQRDEFYGVAQVEMEARVSPEDQVEFRRVGHAVDHPLLVRLREHEAPGLVLFSSGSTGRSKAVVHDVDRLIGKYRTPRRAGITVVFMLFDHIGGVHTIFHVLSSGGTAVLLPDRKPETVCRLVEAHRVETLPTSPTFLNLLLLSGLIERTDLSSLRHVAYTAEMMPPGTLARLNEALPNVRIVQNYGLSEVGILRTKSESSDSLWVQLGGDGFRWRVRDGLLEIEAETAMLGYLNADSPFTEDGWFKTGDQVEVRGDWIKILGRQSDLIIVGGEKVYPAEIEDLISRMPGVVDVAVSSEKNAITGHIVKAVVHLNTEESRTEFRRRMSEHLGQHLADYKIPQKVDVTREPIHNARFKKIRR